MSKKVICWKTFDPEGRNRSNYAQNDRSFFRFFFLTRTKSVKDDKQGREVAQLLVSQSHMVRLVAPDRIRGSVRSQLQTY